MKQIIIIIASFIFLHASTHASEAILYIGKTRSELIELYAPIPSVEKGNSLIFNADINEVPCRISYTLLRDIAASVRCSIDNADLTDRDRRDALARWSKVTKAILAGRHASDVSLKLDGVLIVGEKADYAPPTVIWMEGSWDEKYQFVAAFGGPYPPAIPARKELFEMSLNIFPHPSVF